LKAMKLKPTLNIVLGITIEILYVGLIMLLAFLICWAISIRK